NFLPVGSEMATKWYVEQVLDAGCAFVNCIPVFIAREAYWRRRFEDRGLPVVGDDVKSQLGATILHRVLAKLFMDRGVRLERTSQLNFGGNTDFYNMLERERLVSKKISKTDSVRSQLAHELAADAVHIGPSDYVPWLEDRKWAHIRLEGRSFGDQPINVELKLEVWDSPNSAGVVIDAIRCCRIALDRGLKGALVAPSAYLMKSPPQQFGDDTARQRLERFIAGEEESAVTSRTGRRPRRPVRLPRPRPGMTVTAAVLVAAVSVVYALTFLQFETSQRALLPQGKRFIERYSEFDKEFGDLDDLVIVVQAPSLPEATIYANRLARELRTN